MRKEEFYAEAIPDSIGPLEGLRVLEATHNGAGPWVGTLLCDLGAESIKIDPPDGEVLRRVGLMQINGSDQELSGMYLSINRNKKNITLNLRTHKGQELFRELAREADVIVENYTPGRMKSWGLSYPDIRQVKPDIIYTSVSGFGQYGPYHERPGYDVVGQAMGGIMHITGLPDGPPTRTGNAMIDNITGWLGAHSTLAALYYRQRTGKGQHVDIGQMDVGLYTSEMGILGASNADFHWKRMGNGHPGDGVCNSCLCKDGYVFIVAIFESHWEKFCRILDREDLIDDPRSNSIPARRQNHPFLDEIIGQWTCEKTVAEVVDILNEARLVVAPILDFDQIIEDEHAMAREMVTEVEHPEAGKINIYGVAPKFSLTPGKVRSAAPTLGEHNRDIYCGRLRLSAEALERLKGEGVV